MGTVGGDVSANNRASISNDAKQLIGASTKHRAICDMRHHLHLLCITRVVLLVLEHLAQNKVPWEFCDESKPPC